VWRTIAQNRASKAALKSSLAALKQSEAPLALSDNARKQAQAALGQAILSGEQIKLLQNNRFFDYMLKSFEQLSGDNPTGRLGAIHTLDRLAAESDEDHYTIMRVLAEFWCLRPSFLMMNFLLV